MLTAELVTPERAYGRRTFAALIAGAAFVLLLNLGDTDNARYEGCALRDGELIQICKTDTGGTP